MGHNARNDEIRDNIVRMQREWEAQRDALATVRWFNARLSAKRAVWFWPKIAAAIIAKHPWLVIACDSYGTVVDLDLRVKPRDPEASVRVALRDVRCPRCNGHAARASSHCRVIRRYEIDCNCDESTTRPAFARRWRACCRGRLAHRVISLRRKICPLLEGGLNGSTQHFIFEGKDGV